MSAEGIRARFRLGYHGFVLDVDLDLPGMGVTALFGHSGSGKTTCLRCLAGLERPPGAYLAVNGEVWQDEARGVFLPTWRRPIGMVFQEANLFAHLSVRGNLEYGWKRVAATERRIDFGQAVELLGIGQLLERMPEKLSGGERQRVGIARALLTSPRLLLMDEPLASLDLKRKGEILPYLERLHDELSIPVIYVSHAPEEVARLADHLVVLSGGRVSVSGPLGEVLARTDLPLALGDDAGTVIEATVASHDEAYHLTRLDFAGGSIHVARRPEAVGRKVRLRIHARDVSLALARQEGTSILNLLPARVTGFADADHPAHLLVRLDAGGVPLWARITRRSCDQLNLASGSQVWAQVKAVALLS